MVVLAQLLHLAGYPPEREAGSSSRSGVIGSGHPKSKAISRVAKKLGAKCALCPCCYEQPDQEGETWYGRTLMFKYVI